MTEKSHEEENKKQLAKILEKHREERKRRKENEELFKQALNEGLSRKFQREIDN